MVFFFAFESGSLSSVCAEQRRALPCSAIKSKKELTSLSGDVSFVLRSYDRSGVADFYITYRRRKPETACGLRYIFPKACRVFVHIDENEKFFIFCRISEKKTGIYL